MGMRRFALALLLGLPACDALDALRDEKRSEPAPAVRVDDEAQPNQGDVEPWPEGSVLTSPVYVPMAVYGLPGATKEVEAVAKAVLATHADTLPILTEDEAREGKRGVVVTVPAIDTYAPPTPEDMQYLSVDVPPADAKSVQGSKSVVELTFIDPKAANAATLVRDAQAIIANPHQATHGRSNFWARSVSSQSSTQS